VRLLLDTHAVLWWLGDDDRLSAEARGAIGTAEEPLISAATLLEVAIKASLGKLDVADDWAEEALSEGFSLLAIAPSHASALRALPYLSIDGAKIRDPFDRLLVAQSSVEQVPVVTRDAAIRSHGVPVVW
jgi:PIN domain nuclease of toxin-antitoxin system